MPNHNGSFIELPLESGQGWLFTSHTKQSMKLIVYAFINLKPIRKGSLWWMKVENSNTSILQNNFDDVLGLTQEYLPTRGYNTW